MLPKFARHFTPAFTLLGLALLAAAGRAQVIYSFAFSQRPPETTIDTYPATTRSPGSSRTFKRPVENGDNPPTTLSDIGTNVFYDARPITIATDADYTITAAGDYNDYLVLYAGAFNPSAPLVNARVARAAVGNTATISDFHLAPGNYTLVTSALNNGAVGSATITVTTAPVLGAPIYTGSGTTTTGSPTFNRPNANGTSPPNSLSGSAASVYYDDHAFTAAAGGTYSFVSACVSPSAWNNYTFLYKDTFDPGSPLVNCLIGNDNLTNSSDSGFTIALTAGTTYHFVTTAAVNGAVGTFSNTVSPPATTAVVNSWNGTTLGGRIFHRPKSVSALQSATLNYGYDAHTWTAAVSGPAVFKSVCDSPASWDNYAVLYNNTFDPAFPLGKINTAGEPVSYPPVIVNDDFAGSAPATAAGFTYNVVSGTTYTFVTTGYYDVNYGTTAKRGGTYSGTISILSSTPTVAYAGSLTANAGVKYNRPDAGTPPASLSAFATATYYNSNTFTLATEGDYAITSTCNTPSAWDNFITLYNGNAANFDPAHPLNNAIAAADGSAAASASLTVHLAPGTYTLVTAGQANGNFGSYDVSAAPLVGGGAIASYPAALTAGSPGPKFNHPNAGTRPPTLSGVSAYYQSHAFTIAVSGAYNFTNTSTDPATWDNFIVVYHDSVNPNNAAPFDPAYPLTNVVFAADGTSAGGISLMGVHLTAGKYTLVTTGAAAADFGDFTAKISTGGGPFPPVIPDNEPNGLSATITVSDTFPIAALNRVTINGLKHTYAGDLTATLTHNGVTIELFDRLGRTTGAGAGSNADFNGDYAFAAFNAPGGDLGMAAALNSGNIIPDFTTNHILYQPFLNGTAGESESLNFMGGVNGTSVFGDWTLTIADWNPAVTGTYAGFSLMVFDTPGISGRIALDSIDPAAAPQPIIFTFRPAGGTSADDIVRTVSIGPDGSYVIVNLPKKQFAVLVKGGKYLAALTTADTTSGSQANVNVLLLGGDANNDNSVDIGDFGVLVNAFNGDVHIAGSGYDPAADFNGDGLIDIADVGLLVNNYNLAGMALP